MKKVLVIGSPGSGKSVFSRRLGKMTGLPVIHLDQEYWRPGWVEPSHDEWDRQLEELLRRDAWVIDGNYGRTIDARLKYCDTVIFLDFPRHLCTWRVFKRSFGLSNRPDLAQGCEERIDPAFLIWTWKYPKRSRPNVLKKLDSVKERVSVVTLTTNRQVENYLSGLRGNSTTMMETEYFEISTDKSRLDVEMIHRFLAEESYWAKTRTLEQTRTAIQNSLCFGIYVDDRQIGFGRVVSDFATFAYVGDVFVLSEFRGRGLSKRLMEAMVGHPDLQGLRRWLLATFDAHGLYEQFEFASLKFPERWMERTAPDAY